MHTTRNRLSARPHRTIIPLLLLLAALLLSGCAGAKQELAASQAELVQARGQLETAQAEVSARQTEVAQLGEQVAAAQGQVQTQQAENESLNRKLTDAQAQIAAKETAVADAQKQLADAQKDLAATQKELDEVQFAADRLVTQAETALQKNDLKGAQRIAGQLAEKHPNTPQATRAAEIVTLIEKTLAEQAAAEQARIATATANMQSDTDEMRGVTFYKDKTTKDAALSNRFYAYIGQKDQQVWLRLLIQYYGDDWLFVRGFIVKAGDQVFEITPEYDEFSRDNAAGSVWEWYDGSVGKKEVVMIKAIIAADKPVIRFNGEDYYHDYVIPAAERKALQNVLDAFVGLGGDLDNPS